VAIKLTLDDITGIMAVIRSVYPNFCKGQSDRDLDFTAGLWHDTLGEFDFDAAQAAVKSFISADRSGFAPTLGQLRGLIEDHIREPF
jgi:hypothetical protein